jgi:hypothetical protein
LSGFKKLECDFEEYYLMPEAKIHSHKVS